MTEGFEGYLQFPSMLSGWLSVLVALTLWSVLVLQDWRVHVDQMHQHRDGIQSSLKEAKVRSLTRFIIMSCPPCSLSLSSDGTNKKYYFTSVTHKEYYQSASFN